MAIDWKTATEQEHNHTSPEDGVRRWAASLADDAAVAIAAVACSGTDGHRRWCPDVPRLAAGASPYPGRRAGA